MLVFWTLTEPAVARSWDDSSKALSRLLGSEAEKLRRRGLGLFRWAGVPELQKRGAVHWHLLTAFPSSEAMATTSLRSKHALHARAHHYGFGFQADLQAITSAAEVARASGYLAKYLTTDSRVVGSVTHERLYRRVRSSTGKRRWCAWGTADRCTRAFLEVEAETTRLRERLGLVVAA